MRSVWAALSALTLAWCLAACGSDGASSRGDAAAPLTDDPDPAVMPPPRVPKVGTEPADPQAVHVIRGWLRALRRSDLERAARYFAIPSRFQNATPVLTLDTPTEVLAVNLSFPCGAVAIALHGARDGFTVVRFRLTPRPGAECGRSAGETTGGAIRVFHGRILEWYRLYEPGDPLPGGAQVDPGREAA